MAMHVRACTRACVCVCVPALITPRWKPLIHLSGGSPPNFDVRAQFFCHVRVGRQLFQLRTHNGCCSRAPPLSDWEVRAAFLRALPFTVYPELMENPARQ